MSDETAEAIQNLADEIRDWRQGKPPPMDLEDESIPLLERQQEAERIGDWETATALGIQATQEQFGKDVNITLTKEVDGQEVDIRDEIVRLEQEGHREEADLLKFQLSEAQLNSQYEVQRQQLMWGVSDIADEAFLPEGTPRSPKRQLPAEEQFPNSPLSDVIRNFGDSLGPKRVEEMRQSILQDEAKRAQKTGPKSNDRDRYIAAEARGDRDEMADAVASELVNLMYAAGADGKPPKSAQQQPTQQPPPQNPWQTKIVQEE